MNCPCFIHFGVTSASCVSMSVLFWNTYTARFHLSTLAYCAIAKCTRTVPRLALHNYSFVISVTVVWTSIFYRRWYSLSAQSMRVPRRWPSWWVVSAVERSFGISGCLCMSRYVIVGIHVYPTHLVLILVIFTIHNICPFETKFFLQASEFALPLCYLRQH